MVVLRYWFYSFVWVCLLLFTARDGFALSIRSGEAVNDFGRFYISRVSRPFVEVYRERERLFGSEMGVPRSFGFTADHLWMLIETDGIDFPGLVVLESTSPTLEDLSVYQFNKFGEKIGECKVGFHYSGKNRGVYHRQPNCQLRVEQNPSIFLLHFPPGQRALISEIKMWDSRHFDAHKIQESIWMNTLLGCMATIGIINVLIYFSTRDRSYFLYGFYIINQTITFLMILGIAALFDPTLESRQWATTHGIFVFSSFACGSAAVFTRSFLNMKTYMPVSRHIMTTISLLSFTNGITLVFTESNFQIVTVLILATAGSVMALFSGIRAALHGYKPAYLYSAAWVVFFCSTIHIAVSYGGILEWSEGIVHNFIISGAFEAVVISLALGYRIKLIQKNREIETTKKDHYFDQMMKVFYPHQLHMIQDGRSLEETMPTAPGEACVISFDIIGSSKIQHVRAKEFFRNVFRQCYEEMMSGYNEKDFQSTAFRIKELGDGFLCSVGYPFRAKTENPANDAVKLALRFQEILATESLILQQPEPITCGIGISLDSIVGFYPEFGAKEYDLYGRAIILATRYEAMRKTLFAEESSQESIIILQEKVFASLDPTLRTEFSMVDLKAQGLTVRDDPAATRLFVRFIRNQYEPHSPQVTPFVRSPERKAI